MDEGSRMKELVHEWWIVKIGIHATIREATEPNKVIGEDMKAHVILVKFGRSYSRRMSASIPYITPRKQIHPNIKMRMILEDLQRVITWEGTIC